MTHLNIQQGSNVEIVTTLIIKKLYDAALSVPEPLEGELDAAYMSGNLLVTKAYRSWVEYLTSRFDDLSINVTVDYYIDFEDVNVLNALLAGNFSSDGIGITTADAATATFTNSTFKNNTTLVSFNEFNLFTKANNNPPQDLFYGCTNLESINLSNITRLSKNEFKETKLSSVTIPSGVTEIPLECFSQCTSLNSVNIPTTCTQIKPYGFSKCENISLIGPFELLTYLGMLSLENVNCFSLSILNFANLTTIDHNVFRNGDYNITSIRQLYCPKLLSSGALSYLKNNYTHAGTFQNLNVDLIYFRDITKLHPGVFGFTTCPNLVINNTTPPVWCNDQNWTDQQVQDYESTHNSGELVTKLYVFHLSNITNIYVPDSAVTTYQNDADWSAVASKIKPLSQLTKVATEADLLTNQIALIEAYM